MDARPSAPRAHLSAGTPREGVDESRTESPVTPPAAASGGPSDSTRGRPRGRTPSSRPGHERRQPPRLPPPPPPGTTVLDIDGDNPRPGLEQAADAIATGRAALWWISWNEVYLDTENPMVLEPGETVEQIRAWALSLLVNAWLAVYELSTGDAPDWPEGDAEDARR